jgi:hypothetical protein
MSILLMRRYILTRLISGLTDIFQFGITFYILIYKYNNNSYNAVL